MYWKSIKAIARFLYLYFVISRIDKVCYLAASYIANLVHSDCIIVVVYGSLVHAHNLRSQSRWLVDPVTPLAPVARRVSIRSVDIESWDDPCRRGDDCEIEPEVQLRVTQFRKWMANERRSSCSRTSRRSLQGIVVFSPLKTVIRPDGLITSASSSYGNDCVKLKSPRGDASA